MRSLTLTATPFVGVTLIGGGPGDADLITVAGLRALMAADVVVCDRLAPRDLLTQLDPGAELVDAAKVPRSRSTKQDDINALLIDRAAAGKQVVRLKGGDGYVFGRGFEEVLELQQAGIPAQVIPGLSSTIAVPALAGIPVTHRGVVHEFTVVSGHVPPGHPDSLVDWHALARMTGTVVLIMAVENASPIAEALIGGGRRADLPAAVVVDGSFPTERVVHTTLERLAATIDDEGLAPPAVIVLGEVCNFRPGSPPSAPSSPDDVGERVDQTANVVDGVVGRQADP